MKLASLARAAGRRLKNPLLYMAICGVFILSLHNRARQHVTTLNGNEWQPLQEFIQSGRHSDEPICFLPSWTRGHALDMYKFRGFDILLAPDEAWQGLDEPLSGFWVVSQFDAFDPDDVPGELYPHRIRRALGGAEVFLFRQEPIPELSDSLLFHIREATCIHHGPEGRRSTLVWDRIGFSFDYAQPEAKTMSYLGCRVTHDRFNGRPRNGIWFHPPPRGQALSLTWPGVQVLPWLEVSGGLRDKVAGRGSPVRLQLILDGRTLTTLEFSNHRGWKTHTLRTGRQEGTARLSFKVTTGDKNNHSRHFVFDASMRRRRL